MKAFLIKSLAHPSQIALSSDAAEPVPGKNQVLVEVYSAGLNFFDILQAQGKHQSKPTLPFVLGSEFAGRIAKNSPIPPGCSFKPGDRVFGSAQGAYAEKLVASVNDLVHLPDNLSYDEGAGLHITWPTSYEALVGRANLKAGEWVLVTAAAGAVGIAAVQIAKALGAQVIVAAGSAAKLDIAKRIGGGDYTIDYSKPGWQKTVLEITKGKGVDVIYDPVGLINDALKCIAWKGRAIVVGFAGGTIDKVPSNIILLKNISVVGIHWGAYKTREPSHIPQVWKDILDLLASGRVKSVVYDHIYSLERVADGLGAIERRETWGKAVVRVKDEDKPTQRSKL